MPKSDRLSDEKRPPTVKDTTHGTFMDYGEIMAKDHSETGAVSGKQVEQAMLGELGPNCRMTTHLSYEGDNTIHVSFHSHACNAR